MIFTGELKSYTQFRQIKLLEDDKFVEESSSNDNLKLHHQMNLGGLSKIYKSDLIRFKEKQTQNLE